MEGVVRTRVGYTGGQKDDPSYHDLGDHTESLQIDFDPDAVSYERLLDLFWQRHNPWSNPPMRQYQSAVFFDGRAQRQAVEETVAELEARDRGDVQTRVEPLETFYRAENYHQKYRLRRYSDLVQIFDRRGYSPAHFTDSTAATRLNGFVAGCGSRRLFEREVADWDLPADLLDRVGRRLAAG